MRQMSFSSGAAPGDEITYSLAPCLPPGSGFRYSLAPAQSSGELKQAALSLSHFESREARTGIWEPGRFPPLNLHFFFILEKSVYVFFP